MWKLQSKFGSSEFVMIYNLYREQAIDWFSEKK